MLVRPSHSLVAGGAGKSVRDLPPGREGEHALGHAAAIGRVSVLSVEGGHPDPFGRQQGRIYELARVGDTTHAPGGVDERDEAVRLATAEAGVEAEGGGHYTAAPTQARADIGQEAFQATGRVGVG